MWRRCAQCVALLACTMAFVAGIIIPANVGPVNHEDKRHIAAVPQPQIQSAHYVTRSFAADSDG